MRRLALLAAMVAVLPVASAEAAGRPSCVPSRGFETIAEVGRTRFFVPRIAHDQLLVCRPGHDAVSLIGSALPYDDGSTGGARIERRAGGYVLVSYLLHDGTSDLTAFVLIDAARYRFARVGDAGSGFGRLPSFSAAGYAAALDVTPTSLGRGLVLGPDASGALAATIDPGPAEELEVRGRTARWTLQPGEVVKTVALSRRPSYGSFPASWRLSSKQLAMTVRGAQQPV